MLCIEGQCRNPSNKMPHFFSYSVWWILLVFCGNENELNYIAKGLKPDCTIRVFIELALCTGKQSCWTFFQRILKGNCSAAAYCTVLRQPKQLSASKFAATVWGTPTKGFHGYLSTKLWLLRLWPIFSSIALSHATKTTESVQKHPTHQ